MKLINQESKLIYSITGLPHSGADTLSKVMNSIDGSICLNNPITTMQTTNLTVYPKTLKNFEMFDQGTDNFLEGYNRFIIKNSNYKIGGIKETYSNMNSMVNKQIKKVFNQTDFDIFIIRDPKINFSKWKELKFSDKDSKIIKSYRLNVTKFYNMYESFIKKYHENKMIKPTFLIRYEDFYENFSETWFNDIFKNYLSVSGKLTKIKPVSDNDISIKIPNKLKQNFSNLDGDEIIKMTKLDKLYKNTRSYGYC